MWESLAQIQPGKAPLDKPLILLAPPNFGLCTVKQSQQLLANELAQATNMQLNDHGIWEMRPGFTKVTASAAGSDIMTIAIIPINGTVKYLLVDDAYKLYECGSSEPTLAPGSAKDTLASENVCIVPFSDMAYIMDGSYLKEWNGTSVQIGMNNGTGSTAYFYDYRDEDDDGSISLYSGATTIAVVVATTPNTGTYPYRFVTIKVLLSKEGLPTGAVDGKVYDSGTGAAVATDAVAIKAQHLATEAAEFTFTFALDALTANTLYYFGVTYTGGDASNYVKVHYNTVASGGLVKTYDGSWSATDTTKHLLMALGPTLPPKASFGDVKESRLFLVSPDTPGRVEYSNANTARDWDTDNYAGHVHIIDGSSNSFAAGAIKEHLKSLWIIGTPAQPYIAQLTGSPGSFSLPSINLQVSSNWRTPASAVNDLFWTGKEGVMNLQGVQAYGDVREFAVSDPIKDKLNYAANTQFAVYWDGKYIVKFPSDYNLYVFHVKHPMQDPVTGRIRYPISKWTIAGGLVPTAMHVYNNALYMGCADGHLYKFSSSVYQDNGTDFGFTLETATVEMPFGEAQTRDIYVDAKSSAAHNLTLTPYLNGSGTGETALTIATAARVMQQPFVVRADSVRFIMAISAHTANITIGGITIPLQKLRGKL